MALIKWFSTFSLFSIQLFGAPSALITALSPSQVLQMVNRNSLEKKDIDAILVGASAIELGAYAPLDLVIYGKLGAQDSRARTLTPNYSNRDQMELGTLGLNKKFSTGTFLNFEYGHIRKESDLTPVGRALMPSLLTQETLSLTVKQELWQNSFGAGTRAKLHASEINMSEAKVAHDQNLSGLELSALKLYWNTYVAKESWKQNRSALEKYEFLLQKVEKKKRMGLDDKAEFVKTQAELENRKRTIQSTQVAYKNLIADLFQILQPGVTPPLDIEFKVPTEIKAPQLAASTDPMQLRTMKYASQKFEASQLEVDGSLSQSHPSLSLVGSATNYGLDPQYTPALTQATKGSYPQYYIGIEFQMPIENSLAKADLLQKQTQKTLAESQLTKTQSLIQKDLLYSEMTLIDRFKVVESAQVASQIYERVIQSQESNHRYGRISTAELIMDYNSYYMARTSLSQAIADYQFAAIEYRQIRDLPLEGTP